MRIGVDCHPICKNKSGVGHNIFVLLKELILLRPKDSFYLYTPKVVDELTHLSHLPNVSIRFCPFFSISTILWSQTTLACFAYKDKIDIFWGPNHSLPLYKRKEMKTILTIHDFTYLLFPKTVPTFRGYYLKYLSKQFIKEADVITAISQGTAQKLQLFYQRSCDVIIPPPIRHDFHPYSQSQVEKILSSSRLVYKDYVITIGTHEPRKNFMTLLKHFQAILQSYGPNACYPLVLIGGKGWKNCDIKQLIDTLAHNYPTHLIVLGYVNDHDLPLYLSGAREFVLLSKYEGYGMPYAEARSCKIPVTCLDSPEIREAAENDGTFLTPNELEQGMKTVFLRKSSPKKVSPTYYSNPQALAKQFAHFLKLN